MYFWVVLASFFVAIQGYSISVRDDEVEVVDARQAQGVAANLTTLHGLGLRYVRANSPPIGGTEIQYPVGPLDTLPAFISGYLSQVPEYNKYGSFQSHIYCFDLVTDTKARMGSAACKDANAPNTMNFLITHGQVPPQWIDNQTGLPQYAVLRALSHSSHYSIGAGVAVNAPLSTAGHGVIGSTIGIKTFKGVIYYIPPGATVALGGEIATGDLVMMTRLTSRTKLVDWGYCAAPVMTCSDPACPPACPGSNVNCYPPVPCDLPAPQP